MLPYPLSLWERARVRGFVQGELEGGERLLRRA
jgi:hypothetical protein